MDAMSARRARQTVLHASTPQPNAPHVCPPSLLTTLKLANVHAAKATTVRVITRVHKCRLTALELMT